MLIAMALALYVVAAVLIFMGIDKYMNYDNVGSDSLEYLTRESVNAYVGGDAYNFIINGTYMTGFFTLAAGLIVSATILVALHVLTRKEPARKEEPFAYDATLNEQGGN